MVDLAPVAPALVMSWAPQHLSSLAALVHALEDDYPPDVATLAELSDLLAKAKTATERLLAQKPAYTRVATDENIDETLNAQLAALSVLEVAFKVGDHVHLKDTDRMLKKGVIVRVDPGPPARFDVKATDGVLHEGWPEKSLKLQETARDHASQAVSKPVIFSMRCPGKTHPKKALPPAAALTMEMPVTTAAAQPTASGAEPAAAAQLEPTTAPPSKPAAAAPLAAPLPSVPRMPRLLVVLDTNELLQPLPRSIDREYLMQACLGVEILVPRAVLAELDGLKNHSDSALAGRARRANALLREASGAQEPWLILEPSVVDDDRRRDERGLTNDERIVRCAADAAATRAAQHPADRVVLATSDNNCALVAAGVGLDARPLEQIRRQAHERDAVWRAAYFQQRAADALGAASWARGAHRT